jgi:prephenate dehydrogenase
VITKESVIGILGLGVLGGSYVQALSKAGYTNLLGVDIDENSVAFAKEKNWIKDGGSDPKILGDCDLVISCLYPGVFVNWIKDNQSVFQPGMVLSDVTGVKRVIIEEIGKILRPDVEFIACHPMAGREFRGIQYADAGRFQAANFIIVPTEKNSEESIEMMRQLALDMKFKTISVLSASEHDRMISFLSQLTHVIAVSLMNTNDNTSLAKYTGDSFRDLTRIAKINETMWPELFILNKDYLAEDIDAFIRELECFRDMLMNEDVEGMKQKMIQSTARRACFDKEVTE